MVFIRDNDTSQIYKNLSYQNNRGNWTTEQISHLFSVLYYFYKNEQYCLLIQITNKWSVAWLSQSIFPPPPRKETQLADLIRVTDRITTFNLFNPFFYIYDKTVCTCREPREYGVWKMAYDLSSTWSIQEGICYLDRLWWSKNHCRNFIAHWQSQVPWQWNNSE